MKINCEYDTVTKTLVTTIDGVVSPDISDVNFSRYHCEDGEDCKYGASVRSSKQDKANKVSKSECVYASRELPKLDLSHLRAK